MERHLLLGRVVSSLLTARPPMAKERQPGWTFHTPQLPGRAVQTLLLLPVLPWEMRPALWDRPCPRGVEAPNRQWALGAFQSDREAWRAPFSACYFVPVPPVLWGGEVPSSSPPRLHSWSPRRSWFQDGAKEGWGFEGEFKGQERGGLGESTPGSQGWTDQQSSQVWVCR